MVDVVALVVGVFDALLFRGPNADRRTYEAYSITAKKFDLGPMMACRRFGRPSS